VSAAGKDGAEHVSHVFSLSGTGYELRKPADTSSATLHDGGDHGYVCLSVYSVRHDGRRCRIPARTGRSRASKCRPSPGRDRAHHHEDQREAVDALVAELVAEPASVPQSVHCRRDLGRQAVPVGVVESRAKGNFKTREMQKRP
jgi:hypothetical protein